MTQERLKQLLDYDPGTGVFRWKVSNNSRRAGQIAGGLTNNGYVRIRLGGKPYLAHRLAWFFVHGYFPHKGMDHKNRIRHDNRIDNIREATQSQNCANKIARCSSGLKGVFFHKQQRKWLASLGQDYGQIYLGSFSSKWQAHKAYAKAAKRIHGEFACV